MGPKKHLGQHFLTAPSFARKIAESIPAVSDAHVLEIGPGQGALSIFIKERFPAFHMVEIDPDVIGKLTNKLGEGNYVIHQANAMDFDFSLAGFPLHVVGNLPYVIGAHLIKKTLLLGNQILSCTFMLQREVAERIIAQPHSKANGFLSIFCQFFGSARILFHVPPGAFFPRPSVDSSVFQILVEPDLHLKLDPSRWLEFFAFVDRGFSMRRKQLAKILGYRDGKKEAYAALLTGMGLESTVRPEDCGIDEWVELFRRVENLK